MRSLLVVTLLVLATAYGANAANVFIDDRGEGFPTVTGVPICNGTTITSNCITTPSPFANESTFFTFTSDVNAATTQTVYTRLLEGPWGAGEADGTPPGGLSDIVFFQTTANNPNINVTVCSDPDTTSLSCAITSFPNAVELTGSPEFSGKTENGDFQLVGQYIFVTGPNLGQEIDSFFLASDAPEPASMLILGSGLVALGLAFRQRNKV